MKKSDNFDKSVPIAYYSLGHVIFASEMQLLERILPDLGYVPVQCRNPSWVAIIPSEVYDMIARDAYGGDEE